MDRYQKIREDVAQASRDVIGMTPVRAAELCKERGLTSRWISRDGRGYMITADCRMDRIGFLINNDVVTGVRNG